MAKWDIQELISILAYLEKDYKRRGYRGDASKYAFKRHLLELLIDINKGLHKRKRKSSKYNLFVGKQVKQGKTIQEAARLWRLRKQK